MTLIVLTFYDTDWTDLTDLHCFFPQQCTDTTYKNNYI